MGKLTKYFHEFMESFYVGKFGSILKQAETNAGLLQNAERVDYACGKIIPHLSNLVELSEEGTEDWKTYSKKLKDAQQIQETAKRFTSHKSKLKGMGGFPQV